MRVLPLSNAALVMVCISLAGYCVNNFSSRSFKGNTTLSSFLGAFCIGVLANLYSRLGRFVKNHVLDIWEDHIEPRWERLWNPKQPKFKYKVTENYSVDSVNKEDVETASIGGATVGKRARQVGFGLAAAAMLPAIFVQVPSGLAVGGSLLSGVASADQITRNETLLANGTTIPGPAPTPAAVSESADLSSTAFNVLLSVIQVAISISVGLSLSAVFVYPFGKRRSGLFSF